MADELDRAMARYERAENGFIPAGGEPGSLGYFFDAVDARDREALRRALVSLNPSDEADAVLGEVIWAARAWSASA